jgi:hypothetical protein
LCLGGGGGGGGERKLVADSETPTIGARW